MTREQHKKYLRYDKILEYIDKTQERKDYLNELFNNTTQDIFTEEITREELGFLIAFYQDLLNQLEQVISKAELEAGLK